MLQSNFKAKSGVEWNGRAFWWNETMTTTTTTIMIKAKSITFDIIRFMLKREILLQNAYACVCETDRRNSAEEESKAKQINMKCLYFGRLFVCMCVHLCWAGICVRCHIGLSHQALSTNSYSMQFCCVSGLFSSFSLSLSSPFCSVCFSPIDVSVPRLMKATQFRQCLL